MTEIEQVLSADYDFGDEPLDISKIDGLEAAIKRVAETKDKELVRCEDRVPNYEVYWNDKTNTVRVAAVCLEVSYEVPQEYIEDND